MNITTIVQILKNGELAITPTDTVYGILADAHNPDAVKKVFTAKNRAQKPLLLLAANIEMLRDYTQNRSSLEEEIIENYFPGDLTVLLHKNAKVDNSITCGSDLVGIRVPDNPDLIQIITEIGNPIISTSANLAGQDTITSPQDIPPELLRYISYVEDGGIIKGQPSSIIKIEDNKITIIRNGDVARRIAQNYPHNL